MKKINALLIGSVLSSAILGGCAMTPPKPKTFATLGQYEQYQLNTAIFRITFKGDPDMPQGMAEEIALLKAAKTTVDNGFRYFQVLDSSKPSQRQRVYYPAPMFDGPPFGYYGRYGYRGGWPYYGMYNDPFFNEPVVYNVDPVEVSYTISCSKTPSTAHDEFDAKLILASLGPKYYLNADGTPRIIEPVTPQTKPAATVIPTAPASSGTAK